MYFGVCVVFLILGFTSRVSGLIGVVLHTLYILPD